MDFLVDDFEERNKLSLTFKNRHLPLSDGQDNFEGQLPIPVEWVDDNSPPVVRRRKRKKQTSTKGRSAKIKKETGVVHKKKTVPKKFDKNTGKFIEIIDLC